MFVGKLVRGLGGIDKARIARDQGVFTLPALLFIAFYKAGAELTATGM